jgi:hypothetical protein
MATPQTRFGSAYFGCYDPDHFADEARRMARAGMKWVLFPSSPSTLLQQYKNLAELAEIARANELKVWLSPWGGEFGGEGQWEPEDTTEAWVDAVLQFGPDAVMWDEPKMHPMDLSTWIEAVRGSLPGTAQVLCLEPHRVDEFADIVAQVDSVAIDPYVPIDKALVISRRFISGGWQRPMLWVRAFRVNSGEEPQVRSIIKALASLRPYALGVWGWKGSQGLGLLRSDDPVATQQAVLQAINEVFGR